jgi:glycosyltransferase involved in cell wall biosynthesis
VALIEVVMPVYNAEPYLGEAIESMLNQTMTDFRLLIRDDGSSDNSLSVTRRHAARNGPIPVVQSSLHVGRISSTTLPNVVFGSAPLSSYCRTAVFLIGPREHIYWSGRRIPCLIA